MLVALGIFENITIGAGAAIAAIVSFLGAKPHALNPEWMLRISLVALAVTLAAALWRNFRYPFYVHSARSVIWLEATLERDKRQREYARYSPDAVNIETGEPIEKEKWIFDLERKEAKTQVAIDKTTRIRDRRSKEWKFAEGLCHVSLLVAMICLVCLAWRNF